MDYTSAPLYFRIRKALRYVGLYGIRRTLVILRGQYHMDRTYATLPPECLWEAGKPIPRTKRAVETSRLVSLNAWSAAA